MLCLCAFMSVNVHVEPVNNNPRMIDVKIFKVPFHLESGYVGAKWNGTSVITIGSTAQSYSVDRSNSWITVKHSWPPADCAALCFLMKCQMCYLSFDTSCLKQGDAHPLKQCLSKFGTEEFDYHPEVNGMKKLCNNSDCKPGLISQH